MYVNVFDTETASIKGGVCDIAIATIDDNFEIVWQAESLINPGVPIDPAASGVHHIVDEMVQDAPTLAQFMERESYPFRDPGLVVAGHNVAFDIRVLGDEIPGPYMKICTLKLARAVWPDLAEHKLQTLRYHFRLNAGDAHRAMGDVVTCISLLKLIHQTQGWDLAEMVRQSKAPISLSTKFPFGKHKGVKLKDLPKSYAQWALRELKDLDPDLRAALVTVAA